jgi:hypothetical protein
MLWVGRGLFRGLLFSSDLDVGEAELPNEFHQDADAYEDVENGENLGHADSMQRGSAQRRPVLRRAGLSARRSLPGPACGVTRRLAGNWSYVPAAIEVTLAVGARCNTDDFARSGESVG